MREQGREERGEKGEPREGRSEEQGGRRGNREERRREERREAGTSEEQGATVSRNRFRRQFGVVKYEVLLPRAPQHNGLAAFSVRKGSQTVVLEVCGLGNHVFYESKVLPENDF